MNTPTNPYQLPSDGPWMRRYLEWAAPYYDKFKPEARADIAAFDRWFYSRDALSHHLAWAAGLVAFWLALFGAGVNPLAASFAVLAVLILMWLVLATTLVDKDDIADERLRRRRRFANPWMSSLWLVAVASVGAACGFVAVRAYTRGPASPVEFGLMWWAALQELGVFMLAIAAFATFATGLIVALKKQRLELKLARTRAQSAATQAQLKLLQAQIKPHFLFNTLATLQAWVDAQDTRASTLLRHISSFLRSSTDAMDQHTVSLERELGLVQSYLTIMQHRMGDKLQFNLPDAAAWGHVSVPPALVLSLVENAVEHGVAPSLHAGRVDLAISPDAQGLQLQVRNTGAVLVVGAAEGVGLTNSRARMAAHWGAAATLSLVSEGDATVATMRWSAP